MKLPQLIQEIIDYYRWKAKIVRCNQELGETFYQRTDGSIVVHKMLTIYGWREFGEGVLDFTVYGIHNNLTKNIHKITRENNRLPERYYYSNTKEQLKSLFLIQNQSNFVTE